jgi:aminoglycoside/choline kinase family phosphotransferase
MREQRVPQTKVDAEREVTMSDNMVTLSPEVQIFLQNSLKADDIQVLPIAGDASSRRYYRIIQGDRSLVLMCWEPFINDGNYPFLSVLDHFNHHGVHVPKVIDLAPPLGVVLLEDLGDLTLERKFWENQNRKLVQPFYEQALDELVKMHYPCTADKNNCTAFKISFNTERLLWEMNYGREHLLEKLCQVQLSEKTSRELERLFTDICAKIDAEPKFIAHRDYHSRNVMIKLGKMRVIDFQDARLGAIQYDLVSLLKDSYVEMDNEMAAQLITYYLEARRQYISQKVDMDHFWNIYELQSIQRCFKACGSFASFLNLREDTRYLKYLPQTLLHVRASLLHFSEYKLFLDILEDNGVFARKFELR